MKIFTLSLFILSLNSFAKFNCQILLSSPNQYPDRLNFREIKTEQGCLDKAHEIFNQNMDTYHQVFIFYPKELKDVTPNSKNRQK